MSELQASKNIAGGLSGKMAGVSEARPSSWGRLESAWFLRTTAGLLFVTALVKLATAAGEQGILYVKDPVLGLPYRWTMLGESLLELAVAGLALSRRGRTAGLLACFWLGAGFCCYHEKGAGLTNVIFCSLLALSNVNGSLITAEANK